MQKRLIEILKETGKTNYRIAQDLGVDTSVVDSWIKGKKRGDEYYFNKPRVESIRKICDVYGINIGWMTTGEGEKYRANEPQENEQPEYKLSPDKAGNIIYLGDFVEAGTELGHRDVDYDDLQRYSLPGFEHRRYYIYNIRGDSMAATFASGNQIIVRPVDHNRYIEGGVPYVVITDEGKLFKRVYLSNKPGYLRLESDNKQYQDIEIPLSIVKQVLRFEAQIDFNGGMKVFRAEPDIATNKIQAIESNQTRLADELARLSVQLNKLINKK